MEYLNNNEYPGVLVPESNEDMTDSYAMINPDGCFFSNSGGIASTSFPILEFGLIKSLAESGYAYEKLVSRGGEYVWGEVKKKEVLL